MKKAKEYAEQYKANPTIQTLAEIVKEMVLEIREIYEMRHGKSDGALKAIFNEQEEKWRAFVRLVDDPNIAQDGFRNFCQKYFPEVYEAKTSQRIDRPRR